MNAPQATEEKVADSIEQYYAHMESDRNTAEDAYFKHRPQLVGSHAEKAIFRAGFERAYELLWHDLQEARRSLDRSCQETREALARETAAARAAHDVPDTTTTEKTK